MDLTQATKPEPNPHPSNPNELLEPLSTASERPTVSPAVRTLLESVPLFSGITLTEAEWQPLLNSVAQQHFDPGQVIFSQGETGELLYLVLSGAVEIQVAGLPVQLLELGSYFGEMALFDAQPRSATAIARQDCQCLVLTQSNLRQMIQSHPTVAIEMLRVMALRLRNLSRLLSAFEDIAHGFSSSQVSLSQANPKTTQARMEGGSR
jgi:CRP/FNR family transcriptional regulator, cyclic AMP receptor protein